MALTTFTPGNHFVLRDERRLASRLDVRTRVKSKNPNLRRDVMFTRVFLQNNSKEILLGYIFLQDVFSHFQVRLLFVQTRDETQFI